MADKTIRIENMPSPASEESIAMELWRLLRDNNDTTDNQLKFYTRCVTAVRYTDASYYDLFKR